MNEAAGNKERARFYQLVANGNTAGLDFLTRFHAYMHEIDDIIDERDWNNERVLKCFASACLLYSHPFYSANRHRLGTAILVATSLYNDANKWERDPALWKRWWADVMRHAGNEVIFAVAQICGGWGHLKSLTAPMMAMSYIYHADKYGTPANPKPA
jgi:hypothetical protein